MFRMIVLLGCLLLNARADEVIVTFDVRVSQRFVIATMTPDPAFRETNISVKAHFEDRVIEVEQYPEDTILHFGPAVIASPLTGLLPYGPAETPIRPTESFTFISDFTYPTPPGSYFSIVQSQYNPVNATEFYSYFLTLNAAIKPPLDSASTFNGKDLRTYLSTLQVDGTEFYFAEYSDHFDGATMTYLGGISYSGTAVISDISTVPEPTSSIFVLLGILLVCRRKARSAAPQPPRPV